MKTLRPRFLVAWTAFGRVALEASTGLPTPVAHAARAVHQGHLRVRRALPSPPLPGRRGVPLNTRKAKDGARFVDTVHAIVGKRVTYKSLTGEDMLPATTT